MILNNNERIIIKTNTKPVIETPDESSDPKVIFHKICEAIEDGGYNPVSQIVGYLISEDPAHITNYKSARTLIGKLDRDELLEEMVKTYIAAVDKEIKENNN